MNWSNCLFRHTCSKPCLCPVVGSGPWLQDTSFCDHLPSAAPSVRWTEGAARHFSAASTSISSRFCHSHSSSHDESSWILATTISIFVEMLSEYWRRHSRLLFLHGKRLCGRHSPLFSVIECDIIDQTWVMSDQEPVEQVDTSMVEPDCMH